MLNDREKIFGWEPTDYSILTKLQSDFGPYHDLWTMCDTFRAKREMWFLGPFLTLDPETMEADVMSWWTKSYNLAKRLDRIAPGAAAVARRLREDVDKFKQNLPIVTCLASKVRTSPPHSPPRSPASSPPDQPTDRATN